MFRNSDFERLASAQGNALISIYTPTHRAGQRTHDGHDALVFKNALKEAEQQLKRQGLSEREAEQTLAEAAQLVDNDVFWTQRSDALAVFIGEGRLEHFALPIPIEHTEVHVGKQYRLAPAARMLAPAARWYVLSVTQDAVSFLECTRHSATSIAIGDLVPPNMEAALAVYEGSETKQHHGTPVAGAGGGTIFHGQGSNEDRRDERLEIYFEQIGRGITKLVAGQPEPLVVAADAQHHTGIRRHIDYPHLMTEGITTHPNVLDTLALKRDSWELVQPHFDRTVDELQEKFRSASGGGTLVHGLADVLPAAHLGQVAALFVAEHATSRTGRFAEDSNRVMFSDQNARQASNDAAQGDALLELAIRKVIARGGQVMFRLAEAIPDQTDGVSAVLRFVVA